MKRNPSKMEILALAKMLMGKHTLLPACSVGDYSVRNTVHMPGTTLQVVSVREAFFNGLPPAAIKLEEPYTTQALHGPDGIWMTSQPCELVQMWLEFVRNAAPPYKPGKILIGGLGLGCVLQMLIEVAAVDPATITVVEKEEEVITLVAPYYRKQGVRVLHANLFTYLKYIEQDEFSLVFLDVWQGTGEWVWQTQVVPLRRLIGGRIARVCAWQECTMVAQVWDRLFTAISLDDLRVLGSSNFHLKAFWQGAKRLGLKPPVRVKVKEHANELALLHAVTQAAAANKKDSTVQAFARTFLQTVGTPMWEEGFGPHWDAALVEERHASKSKV